MTRVFRYVSLAIVVSLSLIVACTAPVYGPRVFPPSEVATAERTPLKVHLMSGDLIVLPAWRNVDSLLAGFGTRYAKSRKPVTDAYFEIPLDSIALLETSVRDGHRPTAIVGMTVWSVFWSVTTLICLADPKSCFGSCPTFYVDTPSGPVLAAEGFSSSILRVLEAEDTDALHPATGAAGDFRLLMRNEAWETHAVRDVHLVAVERPADGRIMTDGRGAFHTVRRPRAPLRCTGPEGDCTEMLSSADGRERVSTADDRDLASRETMEFVFPGGEGRQGVVLSLRHSLLSTFLFYRTLGYLGTRAGETFAKLERGDAAAAREALGMGRLIGTVTVEIQVGDRWVPLAEHDEAGPLAEQYVVFPIDASLEDAAPVRIRITTTRGAWRIDWVGMADIAAAPEPLVLKPRVVGRDGHTDSTALALLLDPERHLVTYPGDDYEIVFTLPSTELGWDTFVSTTGYYYEWMRSEWLDDEDLVMAAMVRYNPARALRVLAPAYRKAEPILDSLFWNSRFSRHP